MSANGISILAKIDARRIEQVLANLITNAIKYTVDPGEIRVRVESQGPFATISVTDTGIGVPEDELNQLFTRYGRGKSEIVRKIQGTGLGLLIVKQIVEAHGGKVWARSTVGKGSTFALELPVVEQAS
jgi:two-component system sensor histidine kinase VicK